MTVSTTRATVATGGAVARLHLSESPYGMSPLARLAAADSLAEGSLYPDPTRAALIAAIAAHWGVPTEQVIVGNGTDELVLLSSIALGDRARPGVTTAATFPGYRTSLTSTHRGCIEVPLTGHRTNIEAITETLPRAGITYVCNPHNPTGSALTEAELTRLAESCAERSVPLVVDEAYQEFAPPTTPSATGRLDGHAPRVVLRTFSKAYGLAGLRAGYAIGDPDSITRMRTVQASLPFCVNRIAQAAAIAALADQDFLTEVRRENAEQRAWFTTELNRRGRGYLPSVTNFVTVEVGDSAAAADVLRRRHAILTKDAGAFGLPGYLRVGLGTRTELCALLDALDSDFPPSP